MKKMLALIAMLMIAAPTFAANPWEGDGDTVKVTVNVPEITEVWSSVGTAQHRTPGAANAVQLTVNNAGGKISDTGKYHDTVYVNANTKVGVSVTLQGDIPAWTRFHVIVKPQNKDAYNSVFSGLVGADMVDIVAEKVITFDKRATAFEGVNQPGSQIPAFSALSNAGSSAQSFAVDYAADDIMGMPSIGTLDAQIVYTIAAE